MLKITRRVFRKVLEEYPDAALVIRQDLAARLHRLAGRLGAVRSRPHGAGRVQSHGAGQVRPPSSGRLPGLTAVRHFHADDHRYVVRRALPAAGLAQDLRAGQARRELLREPDVVEPAAAVGFLPVRGAVAPPGVDALGLGLERADRVDPAARLLHMAEASRTRPACGDTTSSSCLWLQTSFSSGATLRSPTRIGALGRGRRGRSSRASRRGRRACGRISRSRAGSGMSPPAGT